MKPEIICEMSCNHMGNLSRAYSIIRGCADAGADAVKIQVWAKGGMVINPCDYRIEDGPWQGNTLASLYAAAWTPDLWLPHLFLSAKDCNIELFASVFDVQSLALLEQCGCPRYKIASFELVDTPLIQAAAETGKPLILSTGMATPEEIERAVDTAWQAGCQDLTLLHCVSAYPAPPEACGLNDMVNMANRYRSAKVGLSDHTTGLGVPIAATALGATMIEKHVMLRAEDETLDRAFSTPIDRLPALVTGIREAVAAMTAPEGVAARAQDPQRALRRSLYWARDIRKGEIITRNHLVTARPALGAPPEMLFALAGTFSEVDAKAGEPVIIHAEG